MVQPYDIQLPDILGQYQRGKDMAFTNERRPIEAQQNDQAFAAKDQVFKTKVIAQRARFLAGLSPQALAESSVDGWQTQLCGRQEARVDGAYGRRSETRSERQLADTGD